jgi:hypothetical protein
MLREVQRRDDCGRPDHGDQNARHALAAPEKQDRRQRGRPEHESDPIYFSLQDRAGDRP